MTDNEKIIDIPSSEQFAKELKRLRHKQAFSKNFRNTVGAIIVLAALAVIISSAFLPVFRVTGSSMSPTLANDDVVLCIRTSHYKRGDIVAFHYNNKVLLKRVIGLPGDIIEISDDGTVTVNGEEQDEDYITGKALGECDIVMPYKVPENRLFVMGDHRAVSIDSRSTAVGCVAYENVLGKVLLRVLPIKDFGKV
ncbi:MAG TPA: signal peptidase I [Ruminococcus sp.]|nr:signal peptidase I [Ruminococcus sp.]